MRHNFKQSLLVGKAGELMFNHYMPHLEPLNGKGADFKDRVTGELWEIKSDQYDMDKTANFFIEKYSDFEKRKPGGPDQAVLHGSKYWCYFFPKNGRVFIFDTLELVAALDPILTKLEPILIENTRWTTVGYKVPREALKHIYKEVQFA